MTIPPTKKRILKHTLLMLACTLGVSAVGAAIVEAGHKLQTWLWTL